MASTKSWIKAARLRTLPLAVSGIIMGAALSYFNNIFSILVSSLAIVTAVLIQVFSNFANDYGDFQKGTDNDNRLGPTRTMQGGEIKQNEMKIGMIVVIILSLVFGTWLIYEGLKGISIYYLLGFFLLGVICLWAAFKYTAGKNPYGYFGLGDIAVFLFFGLIAVSGTYFLNTHQLKYDQFLLAVSIGLLSSGVLNLNNIRDIENDKQSGKITLAVKLGKRKALNYHYLMISIALVLPIIYTILNYSSTVQWIFIFSFPLFIGDLIKISKLTSDKLLDPFLKKLAISTFIFTLLFSVGLFLS